MGKVSPWSVLNSGRLRPGQTSGRLRPGQTSGRLRSGRPPVADAPGSPEDSLVGRSPAMQTVFKRIALVAPTDAGVLITGESGVEKVAAFAWAHAAATRHSIQRRIRTGNMPKRSL